MYIDAKDMMINLDKVSNVGFLDFKRRIVFNFSHSIELEDKKTKEWSTIADYKYLDSNGEEEYSKVKELVKKSLLEKGFLEPTKESHYWVNPSEVSYINFDEMKHRLIFNLSTSVTRDTAKGLCLINDFVFWTFDNAEQLEEALVNTARKVK